MLRKVAVADGRWLAVVLAVMLVLVGGCGKPATDASGDGARVSRFLDSIRNDPVRLHDFLRALPKGGDLHNHLSGAVSTETLIRFAVADGLCVDTVTLVASRPPSTPVAARPPCGMHQRPASDTVGDKGFDTTVLDAWSMQDFKGPGSGHDHFFAAFDKFSAATSHKGAMLAEDAQRAAAEHEFYLETMISRQSGAVAALANQVGFDPDLSRMRTRLLARGAMDKIVAAARADTDADMARFRTVLHCDTPQADPACTLPVRFVSQAVRTQAPQVVFAQLLLDMELAQQDPRYVGINLVAPEDNPVALRDYHLHMRMVGYLHGLYPGVHITLHAGELVPGLVPPADLRFHIRDAITTAHAERIGYGFLQGASLWSAPDDFRAAAACASDQLGQPQPSATCQQLLAASPKAAAEWKQEAAFTRFEAQHQG